MQMQRGQGVTRERSSRSTRLHVSQQRACDALELARTTQSPIRAEQAIDACRRAGWHGAMVPALVALLEAAWHREHEAIARALQDLAPHEAVAALEHAARAELPYLKHDGFYGLARTCTWALADIGTPEAREALERLMKEAAPLVASYAHQRLMHWDEERHRKRT
jgi:hypothetical protein